MKSSVYFPVELLSQKEYMMYLKYSERILSTKNPLFTKSSFREMTDKERLPRQTRWKEFTAIRPTLEEMLTEVLQAETKRH